MIEPLKTKIDWLHCPSCGGKTRTQIRPHKYLSSALKEMEKSYCECCDETGYLTYGKCHGSGVE